MLYRLHLNSRVHWCGYYTVYVAIEWFNLSSYALKNPKFKSKKMWKCTALVTFGGSSELLSSEAHG